MLFEISKSSFRDIGDLGDLTQRMSLALEQPKGSASSLRCPLNHPCDVFE